VQFGAFGVFALLLVVVTLLKGVGVNQEYQRAVIYRLGRLSPVKGPGLYWLIPWIDRAVKVDLRTVTTSLPTQETITKDGVAVKVNATLWYKVDDPVLAVNAVRERDVAVLQAAETSLRDTIGQHELDDLLKDRLRLNGKLMDMLSPSAAKWGVEIDGVELRDLDIPEQMQRALAREAEATREAKARIIKAEGELSAARQLVEAARSIGATPGALELRRLQTITEVGAEHNSTIVIALPEFLGEVSRTLAAATGRDA
jgi:regulator of protease activity HflC (stomatin/prohibitin superfamily)